MSRLSKAMFLKLVLIFVVALFVVYLMYINLFIAGNVLAPTDEECTCKVMELSNRIIIITGKIDLDYGVLCYRIDLYKVWDTFPQQALHLVAKVTDYDAPWYIRGYSVRVVRANLTVHENLDWFSTWTKPVNNIVNEGKYYRYELLTVMDFGSENIRRKLNSTITITLEIEITELSIIGPMKTYKTMILNETMPITIDIKEINIGIIEEIYSKHHSIQP